MRVLVLIPLLCTAVLAAPSESEILARWPDAGPGERVVLRRELRRLDRERRFVEARCVLVPFGKRAYSLAELFTEFLEPALVTETNPQRDDELGLVQAHREALAALESLRVVHKAPTPVGTATLNLLLGYARDTLDAWRIPPRVRLRIFMEVMRNVRDLEERVRPDARTGWIVHESIMPALLGMARRFRGDPRIRESVSEAASLLSLPSVLDEGSQAQLASLASGSHARTILLRAYRRGRLDDLGVGALARSVVAQAKDDDAFIAGAAPLLLELLADANVAAGVRGDIVDVVLRRMAPIAPLQPAARELLAAAYGGPSRSLVESIARRKARRGPVARPVGGEEFRFLQVVLMRPRPGRPPEPVRVVRTDVRPYQPIHAAGRDFVGILVTSKDGQHADFLGPSPGLRGVPDNRLLRRTLVLERIAIHAYGARGEELELCVALPRDGSEPVPVVGARLDHVLDLIRGRLERTHDASENAALAELLVRIGTQAARAMAVRFARKADDASSLLEMLEQGDARAAKTLLARIRALTPAEIERAFAALLSTRDEQITAKVLALARKARIDLAVPAGDALLKAGDASGVRALLQHEDKYARLAGAGLALRLTPLAGGLRIIPSEEVSADALAKLAAEAFPAKMASPWRRLGRWLPVAIRTPDTITTQRSHYDTLGKLSPAQFSTVWAQRLEKGERSKDWPRVIPYLLDPVNPGREMRPAALRKLLDALEARAQTDPVRRAWIDSLTILVVVQSGLEFETDLLELADRRLRRVAGKQAPTGARRKPGLYWPIWAAGDAR
ncbi:MAG: hypothetical protein ACYTEG_00145 [Planctomycetota bacterium]